MQYGGVVRHPGGVTAGNGMFQHRKRLERVGIGGRQAGLLVPQFPRCAGHYRLGEQCGNIQIAGMSVVHTAHGGGIILVPLIILGAGGGMRFLEPPRQCLNQSVFQRRRAVSGGAGGLDMAGTERGGCIGLGLQVLPPGVVVERTLPVGRAPMGHDAARIMLQSAEKAFHPFLLIETVAPVQPHIEPELGPVRLGRDRPAVPAQIESVHNVPSKALPCFGRADGRRRGYDGIGLLTIIVVIQRRTARFRL